MNGDNDNRSLVLTPCGAGAIGVIRAIGPDVPSIVDRLFVPGPGSRRSTNAEDRLRYGGFVDASEVIDDVIVSRAAVRGIPAVDICVHGGVRVIERILESLERRGAGLRDGQEPCDLAWPAAHLVDREAIRAISRAKTTRAARFLARQRTGLISRLEDIASGCKQAPDQARENLETLISRFPAARALVQGATVAIAGPPNAGKSTLFNHLVGRSAAIVSDGPGTTRDWVTEEVEMDGVPVMLVDTAGRGGLPDDLGQWAVRAGWEVAAKADIALLVLDGSEPLPPDTCELWEIHRLPRCCLTVINKLDKGLVWRPGALACTQGELGETVEVSARSGAGIEQVVRLVLASLGIGNWLDDSACLFTARQVEVAASVLSDLPASPSRAQTRIRQDLIGL